MKKIIILLVVLSTLIFASENKTLNKKIAYIVSDTSIPFWQIMTKGLKDKSLKLGYEVIIYNSTFAHKT